MAKKEKEILVFKQYSIKQFICLVLGLAFFLTGIALLITYYVGEFLPSRSLAFKNYQSALNGFNAFTHTTLGFIGWGIISLLFGALVITLVLSLSSKLEDREKDRQARRELRLQALRNSKNENAIVEDVIATVANEEK